MNVDVSPQSVENNSRQRNTCHHNYLTGILLQTTEIVPEGWFSLFVIVAVCFSKKTINRKQMSSGKV